MYFEVYFKGSSVTEATGVYIWMSSVLALHIEADGPMVTGLLRNDV